jgi:hypothetical protein
MGIDVRLLSERGEVLGSVGDALGYTNWLLVLTPLEGTTCLRFVDPYGDAVFNGRQLAVLKAELLAAADRVNEARFERAKQDHLRHVEASDWPPTAVNEARSKTAKMEFADFRRHVNAIIELVAQAEGEPHQYVRFYGD